MRRRRSKQERLARLILCAALTLTAVGCFIVALLMSRALESQRAAERWQGESEMEFRQLSCFLPVDEKLSLNQIYQFRSDMMKRLNEAALDAGGGQTLFVDAWSCTGKALASTDLGKGDASVIAVGGNFFHFHPLRLMSGSYFQEGDLMQDRVLLDEELAWVLFGSSDLQGLTLKIDGVPFQIAGVIQREQDFASHKAYTAGMGLFMSYDAWKSLHETAGITSYELVLAEPVKNFGANFTREKFPIGHGEIVVNSGRFRMGRLLGLVGQFGTRSMQKLGVLLPYWENAARCTEDYCALFVFLGWLFLLIPAIMLTVTLFRLLRRGKEKLADELLPAMGENIGEAIRKRQRRRWEKRQGKHESR
jgi:hypothetical protein